MHIQKSILFKFQETGAQGWFRGLASAFSDVPDRHGDVTLPGAFADTLAEWESRGARIPLLWQHDQLAPVGSILQAQEVPAGLEVEGQLATGNEDAERALRLLQIGGLSLSIGFVIPAGGASLRPDGVREVSRIDLVEISLVAVPADPLAVVQQVKSNIRAFEAVARDVLGLSRREATRLAAGGFSALVRDEPPTPDPAARAIDAALSRIANVKG